MPDSQPPLLTPLEARILGVLVEKRLTVPDTYPLSLNALVAGCNQKTARDPLMNVAESEAQSALDDLRRRSLVMESSGGRVMRYAENVRRVLQIPAESVVLVATLLLRGPQTAAELRANAERLQRFPDLSSVEGFLAELAERHQLVLELPRRPGERENRWVHLLTGPPPPEVFAAGAAPERYAASAADELAALAARVARLEEELAGLRAALTELQRALGGPG